MDDVTVTVVIKVPVENWEDFRSSWETDYVQSLIEYAAVASAQAAMPEMEAHVVELTHF